METQSSPQPHNNTILSLEEIREQYPNQWVLVVNPELDDNLDIVRGEVIANCPTKLTIVILWSDKDQCYLVHLPEFPNQKFLDEWRHL